jgi:hypothetical protein
MIGATMKPARRPERMKFVPTWALTLPAGSCCWNCGRSMVAILVTCREADARAIARDAQRWTCALCDSK